MEGYLGETLIDIQQSEFRDYTASDWAMYYIERYSQIDGSHHKQWVLDQVARILKGNKIILKQAKWDSGVMNWRVYLDEPTEEYLQWVSEMCDGGDGTDTYDYDCGIAP